MDRLHPAMLLTAAGCIWLIAAHAVAWIRTRKPIYAYAAAIWVFYAGYLGYSVQADGDTPMRILAAPVAGALMIMLMALFPSERYPGYKNSRAMLLFARPNPATPPAPPRAGQPGGLYVPDAAPGRALTLGGKITLVFIGLVLLGLLLSSQLWVLN